MTHDITQYCKADLFSSIGKQTPVAARFSTVGGESGSSDTVRYILKYFQVIIDSQIVGKKTMEKKKTFIN